jgi:hypothetical protein
MYSNIILITLPFFRDNQTYEGPMPAAIHYSPDTMATSARAAFQTWYESHQNDVFHFQEEMQAYCRYVYF